MLSRSQVIQSAQDLGVHHVEEPLGAASAAWRLQGRGHDERAAVIVGGEPVYLSAEDWPVNEHGTRLSLIARIDAGRLPVLESDWLPIPTWEHRGARIDVFADRESGGHEVTVLARPSEDDLDAGLRDGVACAALPHISLPTLNQSSFNDDFDAVEDYNQLRHTVAHDGQPPYPPVDISTLLGEPQSLQDDAVLDRVAWHHAPDGPIPTPGLDDPRQWRVLLHLETDPGTGFDYGGGAVTIATPRDDLAAGRYERSIAIWQY